MATLAIDSRAAPSTRQTFALQRSLRQSSPLAVRAQGMYIYGEDGRRFIDAGMAPASAALGHCHPRIVEAVRRQVGTLHFVHGSRFTSPPAEALAERLVARAPAGLTRAYFSLSGSDATEATLKLAKQYFLEIGQPGRKHFIGRRHEYHGATVGALSVGGNAYRRQVSDGLLLYVPLVSLPYAYRYQHADEPDDAYGHRVADELEATILSLGAENVAGFIAETMNGTTLGAVPAVPGYFRRVREICNRHGVLLILDEILCGMGYTGTLHACEQEGVAPDILAIGKALGAGYQPISAVLVSERIVDAIRSGSGGLNHGQTYESHAVGCAAALAAQDVIDEEDLITAVAERGRRLDALLRERLGSHPHVGDIRGRGLLRAIELVEDRATKKVFDARRRVAYRIRDAAADRGLLCVGGGGDLNGAGDHLMVTPPFIVPEAMLDTIVGILGDAFDATFGPS